MFSSSRIVFDSIFRSIISLYLGYGFSVNVLESFLPVSWGLAATLVSAVGFFFVLRWLKPAAVPTEELPQNGDFATVPSASVPRGFTLEAERERFESLVGNVACGCQ